MSAPTTESYTVRGMTCGHCVQAVTDELSRVPGVTAVEVDLGSGRAVVTSDGAQELEQIRHAVDEAGYELVP